MKIRRVVLAAVVLETGDGVSVWQRGGVGFWEEIARTRLP